MDTLKAEKRDLAVKAKRLRREGFVTGNIFGREIEGSIPVQIARSDAEKLLKKRNKGSQILLEIGGQRLDVLIKDISFGTLKGQVENIDFQALVAGEKVHSVAEIVLLNHEKVVGGVLQQMLHEISYKALPSALVEKVEIDVGSLRVGDTILVQDLDIAANKDIELITHPETMVVTVSEAHRTETNAEGGNEDVDA
ncbi:MAG: 50S ribosomal protein L25 [Lachnospiraceae bacterium]|nr:50S ribosomal protein L25 [Lachnospiraceae bacterium]